MLGTPIIPYSYGSRGPAHTHLMLWDFRLPAQELQNCRAIVFAKTSDPPGKGPVNEECLLASDGVRANDRVFDRRLPLHYLPHFFRASRIVYLGSTKILN